MKRPEDMSSVAELTHTYIDALLDMTWDQIESFFEDARKSDEDDVLTARVKACFHRLEFLEPSSKQPRRFAV